MEEGLTQAKLVLVDVAARPRLWAAAVVEESAKESAWSLSLVVVSRWPIVVGDGVGVIVGVLIIPIVTTIMELVLGWGRLDKHMACQKQARQSDRQYQCHSFVGHDDYY